MDFGSTSSLLKVIEENTPSSQQNPVAEKVEASAKGHNEDTMSTPRRTYRRKHNGLYRGARPRDGKWVSEIRIPKTKKRIWLGSHDSPESAARAYDNASYFIHGPEGPFNFPTIANPQLAVNQAKGAKSAAEMERIIQQGSPYGSAARVHAASCPSMRDQPVVPGSAGLTEMAAEKANPEPVVSTCVPNLNLLTDVSEMEPYFPTFAPEETPTIPLENLPFDEEFIKGSDDWILDFMAEPSDGDRT